MNSNNGIVKAVNIYYGYSKSMEFKEEIIDFVSCKKNMLFESSFKNEKIREILDEFYGDSRDFEFKEGVVEFINYMNDILFC